MGDDHQQPQIELESISPTADQTLPRVPPPSHEKEGEEEIAPLLPDVESQQQSPNHRRAVSPPVLFRPRRTPIPYKESALKELEGDVLVNPFALWLWGGSRYSGIFCMASAATIYCIMDVMTHAYSVKEVPLCQTALTRGMILLMLSFLWLRGTVQPISGALHARGVLISRAVLGCLSLVCFVYSVQSLPLSYAILLNLTTPVMASVAARMIFKERITFLEIGGLACSFLGMLFLYHPMFSVEGAITETKEQMAANKAGGLHYIYSVLVGIVSSVAGGISYCFIKSGAKATDQPIFTILAFGMFVTPLSAICALSFEKFVIPDAYTVFFMLVLGVLAFLAEVFLARGLQLEKTSKVVNILYLKVLLTQIWGMTFSELSTSFGSLIGCLLVLASICSTLYFEPQKEAE